MSVRAWSEKEGSLAKRADEGMESSCHVLWDLQVDRDNMNQFDYLLGKVVT